MTSTFQSPLTILATLSLAFSGLLGSFESAFAADPKASGQKAEAKTETKVDAKAGTKAEPTKGKKGEKTMSNPVVVIETSKGPIEVELNQEKAPITVENFLKYVDKGHYSGVIFHRVIPNFMVQGGGFTPDMKEKATDKPIKNEAANGLSNKRGTIAMARTMVVDSASAQFFINHKDNLFLDHKSKNPQEFGYAVFGEVKSGMDVVDAIAKVPTGTKNGMGDVPVEPVTITSVKRK